jgi:hypothetical protein
MSLDTIQTLAPLPSKKKVPVDKLTPSNNKTKHVLCIVYILLKKIQKRCLVLHAALLYEHNAKLTKRIIPKQKGCDAKANEGIYGFIKIKFV